MCVVYMEKVELLGLFYLEKYSMENKNSGRRCATTLLLWQLLYVAVCAVV